MRKSGRPARAADDGGAPFHPFTCVANEDLDREDPVELVRVIRLYRLAEYRPDAWRTGGLRRGQLRATHEQLGRAWGIHRSNAGRFLEKLEREGVVQLAPTEQGDKAARVITIVRYRQIPESAHGIAPHQEPHQRSASVNPTQGNGLAAGPHQGPASVGASPAAAPYRSRAIQGLEEVEEVTATAARGVLTHDGGTPNGGGSGNGNGTPPGVTTAQATTLCVAANKGLLAVYGDRLVQPLIASAPTTYAATQKILGAGVPLEAAAAFLFARASRWKPERRPPRSLDYFSDGVLEDWQAQEAARAARDAAAPLAPASTLALPTAPRQSASRGGAPRWSKPGDVLEEARKAASDAASGARVAGREPDRTERAGAKLDADLERRFGHLLGARDASAAKAAKART
jgi:hypothetical protein